jgi:membrane-bound ClpP family serine protease
MNRSGERKRGCQGGALFVGVILMVVGTAMLLDQTTFQGVDRRWWPFVLLALGSLQVVAVSRPGHERGAWRPGAWMLFVGLWGLANEYQVLGLDYTISWPLLIIGGGLMIVWSAFAGGDGRMARAGEER